MVQTDANVLGAVYEEFGHPSGDPGQHFTPMSVCKSMAAMLTVVESDDQTGSENAEGDREWIGDPACGSGQQLLAMTRHKPSAVFTGRDKDAIFAMMTALNLCFFNVDGFCHPGRLDQDGGPESLADGADAARGRGG